MRTTTTSLAKIDTHRAAADTPQTAPAIQGKKIILPHNNSGYHQSHVQGPAIQFTMEDVYTLLTKSGKYPAKWKGRPSREQVEEYIAEERSGWQALEIALKKEGKIKKEIKKKRKASFSNSDDSSKDEVQIETETISPSVERRKPQKKKVKSQSSAPQLETPVIDDELPDETPIETGISTSREKPKKLIKRGRGQNRPKKLKKEPLPDEADNAESEGSSSSDDSQKSAKKKLKVEIPVARRRSKKVVFSGKEKSRNPEGESSAKKKKSSGKEEDTGKREPKPEPKVAKFVAPAAIKWEENTVGATLSFKEGDWWALTKGGYEYFVSNVDKFTKEELVEGAEVEIKKPYKGYKGLTSSDRGKIEHFGAAVVKIGEKTAAPGVANPDDLLKVQQQFALVQHNKSKLKGRANRYKPKYVKNQKYLVKWDQALKLQGTTEKREMLTSLDIGYSTKEGEEHTVPGEEYHKDTLSKAAGSMHGNELAVSFKLLYFEDKKLKLTPGDIHTYGSGKTVSSSAKKHNRADKIYTLLRDSGRLTEDQPYVDESHSHSEQYMIYSLSRDISVFNAPLETILSSGKKAVVYAMFIEMYSNPNTVCDECHPSLETFLSTSDWKDKVTETLKGKAGKKVLIDNPEIILRVSSNTTFSSTASEAVKAAKRKYTVQQGEIDIHFLERVPYEKYY